MTKFSFIVPVYNVEQYLRKCVDSLLAQDYENYEIIIVDDGSTDNSGAISDEYVSLNSLTHSRINSLPEIRVIHQENGGLSAARNAGIKAADGEYICMVDSDDYWEPNVLRGLMEQVEREQLDVLRFDYRNVRVVEAKHLDAARLESATLDASHLDRHVEYEVFEPNKSPRYVNKGTEVVDGETYLNTRMGYACYAVMYIIKRGLIYKSRTTLDASHLEPEVLDPADLENSCLFEEGIHFEDVEWLPRMMLRAKRVNSTTTTVYNYLVRQGSITKTQGDKSKIRKNIEDQMTVMQRYSELIEQYPNCNWLRNMRSSMAARVLTHVAHSFYEERRGYIERLKAMNVFPLAIANQGKTYARRARLINLSLALYVELMHLSNSLIH